MDQQSIFKYTLAVQDLQNIPSRTEKLKLAFRGVHLQTLDHGVSRLFEELVSSLKLLVIYASALIEDLRTELTMEQESIYTMGVPKRCQDLCRPCNELLDMLEETRDAEPDKADQKFIRGYINSTNEIAGEMDALSQVFIAARRLRAYRQVTVA